MNKKEIERLKALLAMNSEQFTEEQKTELASLQTKAKAAGIDPETGEKASKEDDDHEGMTEDQVKNIVVDALKGIGLDKKSVDSIKASLEKSDEPLTADTVKNIITESLGGDGIDQDALVAKLKEELGKTKGITEDVLDAKLKEFAKNIPSQSKHQFPVNGEVEFPIEHRSGNLSVAEKQLLNLCLMGVSDEAIERSNIKRPTSINDGIAQEVLANAKLAGTLNMKRLGKAARMGKALTTDGVGSGAELAPTDLSSDLQARLYLESRLATAMMAMEINMPTGTFELPISTIRPTFGVRAQSNAPAESSGGTGQIILTAKKLIGNADYSYEADEDSIIAVLPMLQQNMGEAAAAALENALINGDTAAAQDADASAGDDVTLFDGFRKMALAGGGLASDISGTGITAAAVATLRKLMKKYGIRPRDLLIITGVNGYNDFIALDDTLTAEKVGTQAARILTGEAPTLYGIPIICSEQVREDLNAAGVYDGSTTTKGSVFIVHKPSFLLGVRRGFMVEVDVNKKTQMNEVIASFRRAFQPKETPSLATVPSVVMGYNYDS